MGDHRRKVPGVGAVHLGDSPPRRVSVAEEVEGEGAQGVKAVGWDCR